VLELLATPLTHLPLEKRLLKKRYADCKRDVSKVRLRDSQPASLNKREGVNADSRSKTIEGRKPSQNKGIGNEQVRRFGRKINRSGKDDSKILSKGGKTGKMKIETGLSVSREAGRIKPSAKSKGGHDCL